jgi:hypothetical protein
MEGWTMEERFFASFIHCFFIAFGVVIGGAIIGSAGAFFTGESPMTAMNRLAQSLKIWAIVCAIGGTFDAIENFQKGFLDGSTLDLFKQLMFIISSMVGVKAGIQIITWITNEDVF